MKKRKIIAFFLMATIVLGIFSSCQVRRETADVKFYVDATKKSGEIKNVLSVLNIWSFWNGLNEFEDGYIEKRYPFVEYVQIMTATGGNNNLDCFDDPSNREVTNDYNFTQFLKNLHTVVNKGGVPWIKTGMIPSKLSAEPTYGMYGLNLREPYDYNLYYDYIYAIANAVLNEFGAEEVSKWRWGVFTEFNNKDWFIPSDDKDPEEEFCKVYDYTVKAVEDALGKDVFIGAHGLFTVDKFLEHCGQGVNHATGEKGSHIDYLADSYYAQIPTSTGLDPERRLIQMREKAESVGLTDLIYGIDEGRILSGSDKQPLTDRKVGYSIQGPNDAFYIKTFLDADLDFFASWSYSSTGIFGGIDTVSKHVADCFYKMVGNDRVDVTSQNYTKVNKGEYNEAFSGYNPETKTLSIMAYHFLQGAYWSKYKNTEEYKFEVNAPMYEGNVKVTTYAINDKSNFFDDWVADWPELGVSTIGPTGNKFDWSRDSAQCQLYPQCIKDPDLYQAFLDRVPEYTEAAKLVPTTQILPVINGKIQFTHNTLNQEVAYFTIEQA